MPTPRPAPMPGPPGGVRATSAVTAIVPLALVATVAVQAAEPHWAVLEFDDLREGQLEAVGAIVMTLLGAVLLGRARREGSRRSLGLGIGLLVLAVTNLFASIATPLVDALAKSTFATWTTAVGAVFGTALLAWATIRPERRIARWHETAVRGFVAALLGFTAIVLLSAVLAGALPAAFEDIPTTAADITPGDGHLALLVVQLLTAVVCLVPAWRLAVVADADDDPLFRATAIGLAVMAIAFVNHALVPSQFTELLYAGDAFFLLAIAILLWGAIGDMTRTEGMLVSRAISAERRRMADELRAGIAQELAFMASQTEVLGRGSGSRHSLDALAASVERALDESQGALAALGRPVDEPLSRAIADAARSAAENAGAHVDLDLADDALVHRDSRDALVRFTRECVIDATRHRGARLLSVSLEGGRDVALRIADDGRPADPGAFAQLALRERAESAGATFTIAPSPAGGLMVELHLR